MSDLDTVMAEVIDGSADAASVARLAELMRQDLQVRERFLAQVAIAGALRARHLSDERLSALRQHTLANLLAADDLARTGQRVLDRLPPRPDPRPATRWWLPLAAAAAAVLAIVLLLPGTPPAATVIAAASDATISRAGQSQPLTTAVELQNGDRIRSGSAPVVLAYLDDTRVEISADAEVVVERLALGKRLRVERGQIQAHVTKQPEGRPLLALTQRTTVTVLGTQFDLAAGDSSDFVAVQEGTVSVQRGRDHAQTALSSGRAVVVTNDQPLTSIAITPTRTDAGGAHPTGGPRWSGSGGGLRGEYYRDHAFLALVETRTDRQIHFTWPGAPLAGMPEDHFTIRWTGRIQPRTSGAHQFFLRADDGVRLWIHGSLLIDTWHRPDKSEQRGVITLDAGRLYDLKLDYFDNTKNGEVSLWWQVAGQHQELVPASQLYLP